MPAHRWQAGEDDDASDTRPVGLSARPRSNQDRLVGVGRRLPLAVSPRMNHAGDRLGDDEFRSRHLRRGIKIELYVDRGQYTLRGVAAVRAGRGDLLQAGNTESLRQCRSHRNLVRLYEAIDDWVHTPEMSTL